MLAAVCNMQGLWVFVGLSWESWWGVFCFFVLVSLIGQIVTVNLIVNLLWVVVVLVVVLWIGRHVIQSQSAHSNETMHFYAASSWLSSLACLVPAVWRWPERCLVAIKEWYRRPCCWMCVKGCKPIDRQAGSWSRCWHFWEAFLCDSSLCFPFLPRIWHQSKLRHGQVAMILCVVPLSGLLLPYNMP